MIPNNLDDWDYQLVEKLVREGFFETDKYDLKENIPHKSNKSDKDRLEKSACAFANTEGGFLVFGIKDNKSLFFKDRIVGINPARDFPREFGDKIANIEPHLYYTFRNPAITVPDISNVIHVVKIEKSPERPHWTSKREFYFRTNKGNEQMSYQQIKDSFLSEEQRRQKLRLLFIELLSNREQCSGMNIVEEHISDYYSLITLDSSVLQTLLVDTYPIIINDKELVRLLMSIRAQIKVMNNKTRIFYSEISLPVTTRKDIVKSHNEFINGKVNQLIPLLDKSLEILTAEYGLVNPFE
jgi:hypothetical protein